MKLFRIFKFFFVFLLIFPISNFSFCPKASAANMNFSQSILPVKMVYIDQKGDVRNIWSNVSPADSLYVLKFLDYKSNQEREMNERLMNNFQKSVISSCSQEKTHENDVFYGQKISFNVDFINKGSILEEVRTYS